ncbi:tyrosine-type recombinase/integrase [Flavisphingomonas formosensis]|uniref:tyrosine-type recombinase/integrase n=1 Tax=Flavisphingomonas formosensis TaxID=861534 RepID=UPI0012F8A249|nr:integrase arm-type DNA-binding domain-containing protein [Sphingomonas formosensis]
MASDSTFRTAKPRDKPYKIADEKGLYLYVLPSGTKSWRFKYRVGGTEKKLTFGQYPEVGLAEARSKRDDARRLLRDAVDPVVEKKQRAAQLQIGTANTFRVIAEIWHSKNAPRWSKTHARNVLQSLRDHVFPELGNVPIRSITAPMALKVVVAIEERGAIETAHRVRQRMSEVFLFAMASGLAEIDPTVASKPALSAPSKGRFPALTDLEEARALIRATEALPANPVTKLAARLQALAVPRPGVLITAKWSEFEGLGGKEPIWRLSATRMKLRLEKKVQAKFEFIVPLSRQAVETIEAVRMLSGSLPYLFPNERHAHGHMTDNAIGKMYRSLSQFAGRHVPHGWRSTFSTIMNERAVVLENAGDRAIIDLMLAHLPKGSEGIYNRAAYLPRRRQLAQEWADMLLADFPPAADLLKGPRG